MSLIHELSRATTIPELDVFSVPPTQVIIEKTIESEHRPATVLPEGHLPGAIEFRIHSAEDEYIIPTRIELSLKLRVQLASLTTLTPILKGAAWRELKLVKNLLNSLFSSVTISINNQIVTTPSLDHPYRAYIENLLGYSHVAKEGYLRAIGWSLDEGEFAQYVTLDRTQDGKGIFRSDRDTSDDICLYGRLNADLFQQSRALIGGAGSDYSFGFKERKILGM